MTESLTSKPSGLSTSPTEEADEDSIGETGSELRNGVYKSSKPRGAEYAGL